jgi:hypothetical protein
MPTFTPRKDGAPSITSRYMPFDWNGKIDFLKGAAVSDLGATPEHGALRSEAMRQRAAQQGTKVDARHVRMQNRLFKALKKRHALVTYEENFIDLIGRDPGCITYYELKTESTARMCIRQAIGQLLDYSHYALSEPADRRGVSFADQEASMTLIGGRLEPNEIARVAVYLASDEARMVTGQGSRSV